MGWLIRGHAPRGVTAPPPSCTPWDIVWWRHRWVAGSPGYRPFVLRTQHLVSIGASGEGLAWAEQPPAPRAAAGSGAGCRAGGGAAEPRGGGRLQHTVAGGHVPGERSPAPKTWGRHSPQPWRVTVVWSIRIRCARGPHTRRRRPPPTGAPGGIPNPPWASVSAVKCAPLRRVRLPLRRRNPHLFLAPRSRLSQQGSTWDLLLPWEPRVGRVVRSKVRQLLSAPLLCSARPATIGAVLSPCTNSQPRTSMGTWLTWTSTGGYLPAWWGRRREGQRL